MKQLVSLKDELVYHDLWRLAWPVMFFMLFQTTLELVDLYWVGRLGTEAIAALSLANSLFWMLFTFSDMVTISTLSLVARYRGANDSNGVIAVTRHSFWIAIAISCLIIFIIFTLGDFLISLYGVEEDVHGMALLYLQVIGISYFFAITGMALGASLQGAGDTRTPMFILVITNIINLVLDPILIFGWFGLPALGILGAALATLLSRVLGFGIMLYIVTGGKISPSRLKVPGLLKLDFQPAFFKRIAQIGLPACMQSMTRPLTGLLMMWIVALFGTGAIASFGIGLRIIGLCFIFISGLTIATSTMVGQSLGANLKELTRIIIRKAMVIGLAIQAVIAIVCYFAAPLIMTLFTDDLEVLRMGSAYLRILAPGILLLGPFSIIEAVFKGSGNTVPPMASALIANWIIKIPCAYLLALPLGMGTDGVWWAITISIVAEFLIVATWYRRGQWMHREIRIGTIAK